MLLSVLLPSLLSSFQKKSILRLYLYLNFLSLSHSFILIIGNDYDNI